LWSTTWELVERVLVAAVAEHFGFDDLVRYDAAR
jgi:hypothetical protein